MQVNIDPSDDLSELIAKIVLRKDRAHEAFTPREIVAVIVAENPEVIQRRGNALAIKQTERLAALHLRRNTGEDGSEDGLQLSLPGIEAKLPTHIAYQEEAKGDAKPRIVHRAIQDATLTQHRASLDLLRRNRMRCQAREQDREKVIFLLEKERCDSIAKYEAKKKAKAA